MLIISSFLVKEAEDCEIRSYKVTMGGLGLVNKRELISPYQVISGECFLLTHISSDDYFG